MDVNKIKDLDIDKLNYLVDYIEGMPSEVNKFVKRNFGEPYLNPALRRGTNRNLHEYSTLRKYLKKDDVTLINNPKRSDYQKTYCNAKEKIMNSKLSMMTRNRIAILLDSYSYDSETLIHMELEIIKILEEVTDNKDVVVRYINNVLLPYKLQVHDLYTSLSVSQEFGNIAMNDHLYHIHDILMNLIHDNQTYSDVHNLAIMIYMYFKELGIESCIEKYHLFDRFHYEMQLSGMDNDRISQVYDKITSMVNEDLSFGDASHGLIGLTPSKELFHNMNTNTDTEKEIDGLIFFFKNNSLLTGNEEKLSKEIRVLNKDTISSYVDIPRHSFNIFDISENDIGHIRNMDNAEFGIVCDRHDGSIKYILYYEDTFYLLFKIKMRQTIIYGISLEKDSHGNRKILKINETTDYYYKFTSEI